MCSFPFSTALILKLFIFSYLILLGRADDDDGEEREAIRITDRNKKPVPEFRVYENIEQGLPCVIVQMDAAITIEPKRQINKKKTVDLPVAAHAKGSCGHGSDSRVTISWSSFQLSLHFQKSHVSDAWYIDVIDLNFNTSDKLLDDLYTGISPNPNSIVSIRLEDTLYLTPIGRSYACQYPADIKLQDSKKVTRITIQLSHVKIQPFASMTRRQFGDSFQCAAEAGRRGDTVPFAVGMTLALLVVGTVGGYAGYRYFKIRKIEYDTME